jgi:hypothetical protein
MPVQQGKTDKSYKSCDDAAYYSNDAGHNPPDNGPQQRRKAKHRLAYNDLFQVSPSPRGLEINYIGYVPRRWCHDPHYLGYFLRCHDSFFLSPTDGSARLRPVLHVSSASRLVIEPMPTSMGSFSNTRSISMTAVF